MSDPLDTDVGRRGVLVAPPAGRSTAAAGRHAGPVMGWTGAGVLAVLGALALLAPVIGHYDPTTASGAPDEAPSLSHLLGTDDIGNDIFSQLVYGSRVSLSVGLLSAVVAVGLGLLVALLAGYLRGPVETVLMRLVDLTVAFPFLPLVLVLAAFFGRGLLTTVVVIGGVLWARPARVMRSHVIRVREFQHVEAARAMGSPTSRILLHHVLPRTAPLAAAQFVRAANVGVFIEAALAFLGLGDPSSVSWGSMLFFANSHSAFLTNAWLWWVLPPGLALTAAIVGFAFIGYAIEEWSDPRLARGTMRSGGRRHRRRRPDAEEVRPEDGAPVLLVSDLVVDYGGGRSHPAVDGAGFEVGRGRIVGLIGESGSGKTTTAMAVLRLLRPPARVVQGSMLLQGRELVGLDPGEAARIRGRQVGFVPQSAINALNPAYSVHRQVAEAAELTRDRGDARARAHELLERVGIGASRHQAFPHQLSGGMRQRVVIAMAIANRPSLLIADEPVTGLDVLVQGRILRLLLDLRDSMGLSILLISHDLPMVSRVADDLAVMHQGRVVEAGPVATVVGDPSDPYTRMLLGSTLTLRGARREAASLADRLRTA